MRGILDSSPIRLRTVVRRHPTASLLLLRLIAGPTHRPSSRSMGTGMMSGHLIAFWLMGLIQGAGKKVGFKPLMPLRSQSKVLPSLLRVQKTERLVLKLLSGIVAQVSMRRSSIRNMRGNRQLLTLETGFAYST